MGEYFEQPVAGLGAMYATAGADGLMDVAEAAAGVGVDQAAAGLGMMYATAGLGQSLPVMPPHDSVAFQSIQTPTDVAAAITGMQPYTKSVPTSIVPAEATGYASGIFAGTVFEGC
jgi:hypothetical protein